MAFLEIIGNMRTTHSPNDLYDRIEYGAKDVRSNLGEKPTVEVSVDPVSHEYTFQVVKKFSSHESYGYAEIKMTHAVVREHSVLRDARPHHPLDIDVLFIQKTFRKSPYFGIIALSKGTPIFYIFATEEDIVHTSDDLKITANIKAPWHNLWTRMAGDTQLKNIHCLMKPESKTVVTRTAVSEITCGALVCNNPMKTGVEHTSGGSSSAIGVAIADAKAGELVEIALVNATHFPTKMSMSDGTSAATMFVGPATAFVDDENKLVPMPGEATIEIKSIPVKKPDTVTVGSIDNIRKRLRRK